MRGRHAAIALAVLVVLLTAAAVVTRTPSREAVPAGSGTAAALDAALADGRPAYVLIHSLT